MKTFIYTLILFTLSCSNDSEQQKSDTVQAIIPSDAFLVKGTDRDYVCQAEVHDHKNNAFIKVYDKVSGKLILNKRFTVICELKGNPIWIENLKEQIDYFDGEKFHLKRPEGKDSCWLQY